MATITQIHNLRLLISDPPDIIQITIVANMAALPLAPTPQTAYYVTDLGVYVQTELTTGATAADYSASELFLSDARLGSIIDLYGVNKAPNKAIVLIASKLASRLQIVRNTSGTDSTEYIKLLDLYKYYKSVADDFKEEEKDLDGNSTGRWGTSDQPEIAGGSL